MGQLVYVNFLAPVSYRVLGRRAFVAEAVRCYAPHSFSVQTSKERLTLAKHVHAIGQLVSRSRPLLGQLVHVNFLAQRYSRSPAGGAHTAQQSERCGPV